MVLGTQAHFKSTQSQIHSQSSLFAHKKSPGHRLFSAVFRAFQVVEVPGFEPGAFWSRMGLATCHMDAYHSIYYLNLGTKLNFLIISYRLFLCDSFPNSFPILLHDRYHHTGGARWGVQNICVLYLFFVPFVP